MLSLGFHIKCISSHFSSHRKQSHFDLFNSANTACYFQMPEFRHCKLNSDIFFAQVITCNFYRLFLLLPFCLVVFVLLICALKIQRIYYECGVMNDLHQELTPSPNAWFYLLQILVDEEWVMKDLRLPGSGSCHELSDDSMLTRVCCK